MGSNDGLWAWRDRRRRRRPGPARVGARGAVAALVTPVLVTAVALAVPHEAAASAASLYLLGVVAVSTVGGLWPGLLASVLSFLALNFYFTEPRHTFVVRRPQDVVALVVFLAVAAVVGTLVARELEARRRAERRAAETASLQAFTSLLLTDLPLTTLLQQSAASLVESLGLARCSIEVEPSEGQEPVRATWPDDAGERGGAGGTACVVPVISGSRSLGTVTAVLPAGAWELLGGDRRLLEAFAGQIALALDRARTEAEIRVARLDAEVSRSRAALFSPVTHDLRTPLASIKASVTGLIDSADSLDSGQRQDLLRTILEEADRLNRLVGNLLDLARLRAGALTPSLERTGVEDVVEAVIARLRPVLAPFEVRMLIRPSLPEARIDPVQIDQVFTNVLENAARFSPSGSEIRVTVAGFRGAIEATVSDQGPGIAQEDRQRVFEPFHSKDAGAGRGGTGLGLAIARAVVQAHGGRMWIEGVPAGGTAVKIRLPAAPEEHAPTGNDRDRPAVPASGRAAGAAATPDAREP